MRKLLLTFVLAWLCAISFAQDADVTNYKNGIGITYSGTRGTDFAEEYFYHDKLISDRKVVYVKAATTLTLAHNVYNTGGKGAAGSDYHLPIGQNGLDTVAGVMLSSVTASASTDTLTKASHGLANNTRVMLVSGTGFGGWTLNRTLYVVNAATDTFQVSATSGGAALDITSDGTSGYIAAGDDGVIRYRVDGDMHWGPRWTGGANGDTNANPAYLGTALAFSTLTYPTAHGGGGAVLGAVGGNGQAITDKSAYFHYGIEDSVGDEWHTITVADDDWIWATGADSEWRASDGRVFLFVVNPKTPCLTWKVTGDGQFYTTPPKNYFIPKIHDQITYISKTTGTVTVDIVDINGGNVYWRIVTALNSADAYTNEGDNSKTLTDADFPAGTSYLQYYYAGNAAYTKTRTVVKNPSSPGASETGRGYLLALNADNVTAMQARKAIAPYAYWYNRAYNGNGSSGGRTAFNSQYRSGFRVFNLNATPNAVLGLLEGNAAAQSGQSAYIEYARRMILENTQTFDSVGWEIPWPENTLPCKDTVYRGYYDCERMYDTIFAYDIVAAQYRSSQVAGGLTPVDEYFVRDCIARFTLEGMMQNGGWSGDTSSTNKGGMWDVPRKAAGATGMLAMPTYSSHYYGTSGLDNNTATFAWVPYPNYPLTWKTAFVTSSTLRGYPDYSHYVVGYEEYQFNSDGDFADRSVYVSNAGIAAWKWANVYAYHLPSYGMPNTKAFFREAAAGTVIGLKDGLTAQQYFLPVVNDRFSEAANIAYPVVTTASDGTSDDSLINGNPFYSLAWYDIDYAAGEPPAVGPTAPSGLTLAAYRNTGITASWTDNSNNETTFEIQYRIGAGPWSSVFPGVDATSIRIDDLSAGTTYEVQVRATNSTGSSAWVAASPTTVTTGAASPVRRSKNGGL